MKVLEVLIQHMNFVFFQVGENFTILCHVTTRDKTKQILVPKRYYLGVGKKVVIESLPLLVVCIFKNL